MSATLNSVAVPTIKLQQIGHHHSHSISNISNGNGITATLVDIMTPRTPGRVLLHPLPLTSPPITPTTTTIGIIALESLPTTPQSSLPTIFHTTVTDTNNLNASEKHNQGVSSGGVSSILTVTSSTNANTASSSSPTIPQSSHERSLSNGLNKRHSKVHQHHDNNQPVTTAATNGVSSIANGAPATATSANVNRIPISDSSPTNITTIHVAGHHDKGNNNGNDRHHHHNRLPTQAEIEAIKIDRRANMKANQHGYNLGQASSCMAWYWTSQLWFLPLIGMSSTTYCWPSHWYYLMALLTITGCMIWLCLPLTTHSVNQNRCVILVILIFRRTIGHTWS
jgi:hypothetical protein